MAVTAVTAATATKTSAPAAAEAPGSERHAWRACWAAAARTDHETMPGLQHASIRPRYQRAAHRRSGSHYAMADPAVSSPRSRGALRAKRRARAASSDDVRRPARVAVEPESPMAQDIDAAAHVVAIDPRQGTLLGFERPADAADALAVGEGTGVGMEPAAPAPASTGRAARSKPAVTENPNAGAELDLTGMAAAAEAETAMDLELASSIAVEEAVAAEKVAAEKVAAEKVAAEKAAAEKAAAEKAAAEKAAAEKAAAERAVAVKKPAATDRTLAPSQPNTPAKAASPAKLADSEQPPRPEPVPAKLASSKPPIDVAPAEPHEPKLLSPGAALASARQQAVRRPADAARSNGAPVAAQQAEPVKPADIFAATQAAPATPAPATPAPSPARAPDAAPRALDSAPLPDLAQTVASLQEALLQERTAAQERWRRTRHWLALGLAGLLLLFAVSVAQTVALVGFAHRAQAAQQQTQSALNEQQAALTGLASSTSALAARMASSALTGSVLDTPFEANLSPRPAKRVKLAHARHPKDKEKAKAATR